MKKTDIRVKRTYNQLFEALLILLGKKNFDDLTVLEICNEASVHRATFYKHFVDKYDFLNACFRNKLSELVFDKIESNYTPETMKKSCMQMIERALHFADENKKLLACVSEDKCSLYFNTALTDSVAVFIKERIETVTGLSFKNGCEADMLSNYYAGAIVGLIKWWITVGDTCSLSDLLDFAQIKINDLCNYFNMFVSE